jgi:predicted CXXCH cytochrome family protein
LAAQDGVRWPALLAGLALIFLTASAASAGIINTKHNLTNPANEVYTPDIEQICAFCHTPHGGDVSATVPLWNKGLPTGTTYQTYASLGTTTLDSEQADIGSVSLACLSCHDGVSALDVLINAPGSGWGEGTGEPITQEYTFEGSNQFGTGSLTGVSFIGVDLQNDHPISIQYGGGGIDFDNPTNPTNDSDFITPQWADLGGSRVWWIDTPVGTSNKRDKTDLPLYTRENSYQGQTLPEPFVECASCHNPHSENETFLRTPDVEGLQLCQNCHTL